MKTRGSFGMEQEGKKKRRFCFGMKKNPLFFSSPLPVKSSGRNNDG
jgi:hypothetical protein